KRNIDVLDKPLEVFYEQIAKRNAFGLSGVEESEEDRVKWENKFEAELTNLNFIPDGRVRSEEHTSEIQSRFDLVCRFLIEIKKNINQTTHQSWRIKEYKPVTYFELTTDNRQELAT